MRTSQFAFLVGFMCLVPHVPLLAAALCAALWFAGGVMCSYLEYKDRQKH